jgi:hypothetical protein
LRCLLPASGRKTRKLARADWVEGLNAQIIPRLATKTSRQTSSILTENISRRLERFAQIVSRLPSFRAASRCGEFIRFAGATSADAANAV